MRRQDGARPCTGSSLQLRMGSASFEFSIQNVDQYMYMYPPAPTPDQSLESAEAPLNRALTATCTRAHLPQRPTNPLRVRMLHFPPLGEAGAEAGQHTTMQQFKV